MKELQDITRVLKAHKSEISLEFKAQIVGIFGSYARGSQGPESDVDILVRFEEGATIFDLVGLGIYLEELLKIKVDVVSERALRVELREKIIAEVVSI